MFVVLEDGVSVLDTDDFVIEKATPAQLVAVKDQLRQGYDVDDAGNGIIVISKVVSDSNRNYKVMAGIGKVGVGYIHKVQDTLMYYPSVNWWVNPADGTLEVNISYHDKHYFREDVGLDFERVIRVEKCGNVSDTGHYYEREY